MNWYKFECLIKCFVCISLVFGQEVVMSTIS